MIATALFASIVLADSTAGDLRLGLYVDRKPTVQEVRANFTAAKHEPAYGCYLGAYIDLDSTMTRSYDDSIGRTRRLPEEFEKIVGKVHASYYFYLGYGRPIPMDWVALLGMQGKIVHIALEPNRGIEYVLDDEYLTQLAKDMKNTGAKIFLRFASEMNGAWVEYGKDPKVYKEKFRLVSRVMKRHAPNVAMVWCPYTTPATTIDSYYPGDEYVDWVGVNMYSVTYYNQDRSMPARQVHPVDMLDRVYRKYSSRKPIMIGEYGTTHFSALENKSVTDFALRNLYGLYAALPRKYPRVKAINYFSGNNLELSHRMNNNYAITQNAKLLKAYKQLIEAPYFLSRSTPSPDLSEDGAGGSSDDLPISPLPLRNGDVVSGKIDLSAWCRTTDLSLVMKFRIDGKLLYEGYGKQHWYVTIGASRLTEGWHVFSVEAWSKNRKLATSSARVKVVH